MLLTTKDPKSWRRLVQVFAPLVYQWCRKAGLQSEDAADVGQEVFRSVAGSIATFRKEKPGDSFRAWLATITRNKIRDHWRKCRKEPQAFGGTTAQVRVAEIPAEDLEESVDGGSEDASAGIGRRALALVKGEFEERTWRAFWEVAVARRSPSEAAAALGVSVNAIYLAKSRVLRRLRAEFGDLLE